MNVLFPDPVMPITAMMMSEDLRIERTKSGDELVHITI
jgi:hypothetical protein